MNHSLKKVVGILFMAVSFQLAAQNDSIFYYNKKGKEISQDSAFYFTIGTKINRKFIGEVNSFFIADSTLKSNSIYNKNGLHGIRTLYYENGRKRLEDNYVDGSRRGKFTTWYHSGNPKEIREYFTLNEKFDYAIRLPYKILNHWDSLGNHQVIDGNGYFIEERKISEEDESIYDRIDQNQYKKIQGSVKKGRREGEWEGVVFKSKFTETYKKGILKNGKTVLEDDTQINYKKTHEQPRPNGGFEAFYKYIGSRMIYPNDARRRGVEGRVFVQFIIDKNGEITEVKTVKGIFPSCDKQAELTIKNAPKWEPGRLRGIPIKVRMILPITFKLS